MNHHEQRTPRAAASRTRTQGVRVACDRDGSARPLVRRAGLVLLTLMVVVAGSPGTASAAVAALERVTAQSALDSSSNKSATVSCPAGKQVTGAAADIAFASGQVVPRQIRPNAALTSVTALAIEDQNGYAGNWEVRAAATCATPPAGLQLVTATSASDSSNKSVTAACPTGTRLLGTGAELAGGGGQVAINDIIPGLKAVTVRGMEDGDGTTVNWSVTAHAICANPVAGLGRAVAASPNDSSDKAVQADCPAGKRATGVGAELAGGGGEVVLDGLFPLPGLTTGRVEGSEDEGGTAGNWLVRSFAICAASSERVVATSNDDSAELKQQAADCAFEQLATGIGGDITGGGGQVGIIDLQWNGGQAVASAVEDDTGTPSSWFLRSYAICSDVFVLDWETVPSFSSDDSSSPKAVTATCPAGKRVIGVAGGVLAGPNQRPMLNSINPNAALTSVTAVAFEDENGYANDWQVYAEAICASPPPGLELISVAGDPDSDPAAGVTATCPGGKNLFGMGAEIDGGLGQVVLDDFRPNALLTTVTVTGLADETGYATDWFLRAHAICANA
jgi:hypothetical protein